MSYRPWNKGMAHQELHSARPFEIPKGYTSPFAAQEKELEKLWKGKGTFLRKYHPNKKNYLGMDVEADPYAKELFNPTIVQREDLN